MEDCRASRRVALQASVLALFCLFYLDTPWNPLSKIGELDDPKSKTTNINEQESNKEDEEDVKIPDEMPEDAVFIPLGRVRQLPQTFYKGTDPEWQSFIEFSKDKKKSLAVRSKYSSLEPEQPILNGGIDELAGLIGRHIGGMKNFEKQLGKPIQPRKYWLDIDFPDGPPPEYERSGYARLIIIIIRLMFIYVRLEIADNYIAWTTRPIDPVQVSRLQATLWPKSIAVSVWSSYNTLWSLQVARAKQFLGIQSDDKPESKSTGVVDFQEMANKSQKKKSGTPAEPDAETEELPVAPHTPSRNLSSSDDKKASEAKQRLQSLGLLGVVTDFSSALTSFKDSLLKTWKFPHAPPERGTVLVSGLVELVGSKATCVLDVRAAFHPKENRFVAIGVGVRRLQARKQAPKGGA